LRLRAYDKLQNLVQHGQVKKTGKQYKGVRKGLLLLAENLKAPCGKTLHPTSPGLPPPVRVTALRAGAWPRKRPGITSKRSRRPSLVAEAKQGNRSPGESSSGRRSFAYGSVSSSTSFEALKEREHFKTGADSDGPVLSKYGEPVCVLCFQ
jgi:hypothetical protein